MNIQDTIQRILENQRLDPIPARKPISCQSCGDTGLIELIGGEHNIYSSQNGARIEATPDQPIYRQCECVHRTQQRKPQSREF